jgi:polar amino acid transport system permease protein
VNFDVGYLISLTPMLFKASLVTLAATLCGSVVAAILGLILAIARRNDRRAVRIPTAAFVEFVRSTPLLIQLYFLFYVFPLYGLQLPPFLTGVLALGIYYATYMSEVYRAGIQAVSRGQWEAASALHLSRWQTWRLVILPQALPPVIPPLGNYVIAMLKHTPLLAMIGVMELLGIALFEAGRNYRYYEPFTAVAVIFLAYSLIASFGIRWLEHALGVRKKR